MAIISPYTLIRTISLFHITAAYFFLTAPRILADQNVVFILGESMRINHATSLDKPSEATAFIAILLALLGISDLTAANMNENTSLEYWLSNVPVRLTFLFGLTGYVYLFKEDGIFGSGSAAVPGIGEPLQNSLVFAFGFFEIAMWFWIFTSLREERGAVVRKRIEELKAQEDMM
ncbi:putative increased loss of mitochondrial DNA protein [Septoria linicola]|nr:putative increased loss of mitochondrial DNA protein [Septoria linicola]